MIVERICWAFKCPAYSLVGIIAIIRIPKCVHRSAKSARPAKLSSGSAWIEQWDRPDWAVPPLRLNMDSTKLSRYHKCGRSQGIRHPVAPSACARILFRQWLWCKHRGRFGRRWHQPAVGQIAFPANPECQTGNRRSWSFACTGTSLSRSLQTNLRINLDGTQLM